MNRKYFIRTLGALGAITFFNMTLRDLKLWTDKLPNTNQMPIMFVGHGNPMNAIEDNPFSRAWRNVGKELFPSVILCISAHWETNGSFVTSNQHPETIHDFGGFPQALFDTTYPAPGSIETAKWISSTVNTAPVSLTEEWGLDHGTWSVLNQMFPTAEVPVLQLSLDRKLKPAQMYQLAAELAPLRKKGVLIIGSGNIVHNLRLAKWGDDALPYEWALDFDNQVKTLIDQRLHNALINYHDLGEAARLSIPTAEHYLPMLYILGLQGQKEDIHYFNEEMAFGSGSMRSFIIT